MTLNLNCFQGPLEIIETFLGENSRKPEVQDDRYLKYRNRLKYQCKAFLNKYVVIYFFCCVPCLIFCGTGSVITVVFDIRLKNTQLTFSVLKLL